MAFWRLRFFAAATVLFGTGATALAADYAPPQCYDYAIIAAGRAPPGAAPCYVPPPPPPVIVEEFGGWYLRGDIGFSNQRVKSLDNPAFSNFQVVGYGFDSASIFGLGVGYYFNDWLRFDLTGEYRGRANFHGLENYGGFTDEYHASKSEWLFLANAYIDLGTWYSITPFVGAGIGMSRNTIHDFTDINTPNGRRRVWRRRVEMEFRVGTARRPCLQGVEELHGRVRLSLRQSWRCGHWRHRHLSRHQQRLQSYDVQEPVVA